MNRPHCILDIDLVENVSLLGERLSSLFGPSPRPTAEALLTALAVGILSILFLYSPVSPLSSLNRLFLVSLISLSSGGIVWVSRFALIRMRERREGALERLESELKGKAEEAIEEGMAPSGILEETSAEESDLLDDRDFERVRRKAAFSVATDSSRLYQEAIDAGFQYLPGIPRSGVRYVNRVRLLSYLSIERGLLTGVEGISPRSIGYWAVVVENWPELAQALRDEPERASDLVSLAHNADERGGETWSDFEELVSGLAPSCVGDPDLIHFFRETSQEGWQDDLPRIVEFKPPSRV